MGIFLVVKALEEVFQNEGKTLSKTYMRKMQNHQEKR